MDVSPPLCQKYLPDLRVFCQCLEYFKCRIISPANKDKVISSFPIRIYFISFSCLIALAMVRNSSMILKKGGESGHPCLAPDFGGNYFSILK
jgi:hypothetical protein